MEKAPVLQVIAWMVQPEHRERFFNWMAEVWYPLAVKIPFYRGIDRYQIVNQDDEYVPNISFYHFDDLNNYEHSGQTPEVKALRQDAKNLWVNRRKAVWGACYQVTKYFRNDQSYYWAKNDAARVGESPIIHLEGYRLSPEAEERYSTWLARWGYEIFIPLLMKLPGLKEYDCFRIMDPSIVHEIYRVDDFSIHPPYLSILHFESIDAYKNYEKSIELAAMRTDIGNYFPRGLDFKWYVKYQLLKSWRK